MNSEYNSRNVIQEEDDHNLGLKELGQAEVAVQGRVCAGRGHPEQVADHEYGFHEHCQAGETF